MKKVIRELEELLSRNKISDAVLRTIRLLEGEDFAPEQCDPCDDPALMQLIGLGAHESLGMSPRVDFPMLMRAGKPALVFGLVCIDGNPGLVLFSKRLRSGFVAFGAHGNALSEGPRKRGGELEGTSIQVVALSQGSLPISGVSKPGQSVVVDAG